MKVYKVIGLMSGTSLDGLDMVYCHIWKKDTWQYKIVHTKSILYDDAFKQKLKKAIDFMAIELLIFHNEYGRWLGKQTKQFVLENNLEVDFITSHGHTIHHQPEKGLTYQIGSGQHLANASGCKVICDFRTNDVSLGGQGAPLVPIGDRLFFGNYDFCLNLGGISNISYEKNGQRIAYDIGLANMNLNYLTRKHGLDYDDGGNTARTGKINQKLLNELNELAYYKLPYPKSTGYEWFVAEVVPVLEKYQDSLANLLHTSIVHNCEQIANVVLSVKQQKESKILVTGGGALNLLFMKTLQSKLGKTITITRTSNQLIEFKEALVFALMGVLRVENKTNVLASVTGAKNNSCSGVIFLPQ